MLRDTLIGGLARRFCRRVMRFPESGGPPPAPEPQPGRQYLLYLHVPFCVALCPFCSFHRVTFSEPAARSYFRTLREEIRLVTRRGFGFDELYVGGGTPTVMPEELGDTIRLARDLHGLRRISVETNPNDLGTPAVGELARLGVERLSVGVQSFDDGLLRDMQRYERYGSSQAIRERLKAARDLFPTLNVDMIFNLPHQTADSLRRDLDILIDDIGVGQVSFYPLMAARDTRRRIREHMGELEHAREQRFYRIIAERMLAAGYSRSSAWCFDRASSMSDEYVVDRDDYLGLGSGAFSYLDGVLTASSFSIRQYEALVGQGNTGAVRMRRLSRRDRMRYYLLMHLFGGRLDLDTAERLFDGCFASVLRPELTALRALGAVHRDARSIRLTESGYYLWVVLMREFFTGLNRLRDEMRRQRAPDRVAVSEPA